MGMLKSSNVAYLSNDSDLIVDTTSLPGLFNILNSMDCFGWSGIYVYMHARVNGF